MDTKLSSGYAEVANFLIWGDATTLGTPDQVWRDLEADITLVWIILPGVERRERRPPTPVTATGPSETSVLLTALDTTEDRGDSMAMLEIAAETGDETACVEAASEIDWPRRPAADFARAVRLALAAGAHLLARKLARHGHRLYPDHDDLARMARILAPPRVVRANLPPVPIELDVEREVIAHLPPKQVFETTLRVRYGGRARPNITLEMTQDDIWEA